MDIEKTLKEGKKRQVGHHLGFVIAFVSFLYGLFVLYYDGYFSSMLEKYISTTDENWIGVMLLFAGLFKMLGVLQRNGTVKLLGIYLLLFIWSGIFAISVIYALGDGYPSPMPLFFGKMVWDCIVIVLRGNFDNE